MKRRIGTAGLYLVGGFCLLYFLFLIAKTGPGNAANYIWLVGGSMLLGMAMVMTFSKRGFDWMPRPIVYILELLLLAGCLLFVVVEALIIAQSCRKPQQEADYVIVLGAQVRGKKPSLMLAYRIDRAAQYLLEHPRTIAVVSGGKGDDEDISEAEAMKEGLIEKGIEEDRILLEDQSTSTKENLEFSKQYLDEKEDAVLVVTSDFHVLRALGIAHKQGYTNVEGLSAKSVWYLIPSNYVREFLAVLKDKWIGNM